VEHELLTLPEYLSLPPVFGGVRVARSLVFCVVFCRSLFVLLFLFLLAIVFSVLLRTTYSDYRFWSSNSSYIKHIFPYIIVYITSSLLLPGNRPLSIGICTLIWSVLLSGNKYFGCQLHFYYLIFFIQTHISYILTFWFIDYWKTSLKIPKQYSEAVNLRTDNIMTINGTKGQRSTKHYTVI
jgi:hypothetical protein